MIYQPKVTKTIETVILSTALICMQQQAIAQSSVTPVPALCTISPTPGTGNNYSQTIGATSVTLIPAPPQGVVRSGVFIQLLTSGASLAINIAGQSVASGVGDLVVNTQYGGFNFSAFNFIPSGAITAKADSSGRVVSAFACPR